MGITDLKMTIVTVPMEALLRWSLGVETVTTPAILEIFTDEGVVGLGKTYGGESTLRVLEFTKPILVGKEPFEIERILKSLQVFCISY
jgi:L-alanine-DL-glutamate epimerase-like enolase superfamily enzyme